MEIMRKIIQIKETWVMNMAQRFTRKNTEPPELHKCPHCGAKIPRLTLVCGGIIRLADKSRVKAVVGCRDCHRTHLYRGLGIKAHWLVLQLQNQKKGWSHA